MGHYWSEMRDEMAPRHPTPLQALDFARVSSYDSYNQWYHRPCLQMFYIGRTGKLPDAIYRHARKCNEDLG